MKIENYYVGNICVCTSITSGITNKAPNIKCNRISKQIVLASVKDSAFLVPVQMIKDKQDMFNLKKAIKENSLNPNVVLLKKHHVEVAGDYFAEIDEQILPNTITPSQKEQIKNFENLLRVQERAKLL